MSPQLPRPATAATSLANLPARLLLARPETAAIMHRTRASHACAAPPVGPPPARGDARHAGEGVVGTSAIGFGKPASAAGVGAAVSVGGVGVEGVGGGMAGGVLAAIAGRRPRRQRRRQRWPPSASGAGRHLEMGLGPVNEQAGQNVRAWRLGANMPGLGMRSGGCGCEMQGPRGAGGGYTSSRRSR